VWLFPLDYGKKHHFTAGRHNNTLPDVSYLCMLNNAG
jgi:phosphatidylinositol 4-kinase